MAWPISAALAAALASRTRTRATSCDITRDGTPVITGLRCTAGSVNISSDPTTPRRQCTITALDINGDLAAGAPGDTLAPYGNEIVLRRGINVPGFGIQDVPLGVFGIQSSKTTWSGGAVTVDIAGSDRTALVSSDKFTDYENVPNGASATYALRQVLGSALPDDQVYTFAQVNQTVTSQTYAPGDDRWAAASTFAAELGCHLYFAPDGSLILAPIEDPSTQDPAWVFAVGDANLTAAQNSLDRTAAYNVVVATAQGSNVDTPLLAVARDTDPSSPTYVNGPFGSSVLALQSETLNTGYDLGVYAQSQLLLNKGATQQAQLTSMTLPQLDAFDVIEVDVGRVKLAGRYVLDQLSIPVAGGTMSATTRGIVLV